MVARISTAQLRAITGQSQTGNHTQRNRQNQATGHRFEDRLLAYHRGLTADGVAEVYKTNPDIRITAPGQARIVGRGPCDYIAFSADGRIFVFDAKSRQKDAFSLDKDTAHQIAWLRTMRDYGHTAGYLVYWSDYDEVRWHSINGIDKRVRRGEGIPVNGVRWLDLF